MANRGTEIKWGIYFVLAGLIWMVLERVSGLHTTHIALHPLVTNIFIIPAFVIYGLALTEKRKQLGGAISFQKAFISGLIISLVVTVLTPLSQYLTHKVISPEYFANAQAHAVASGAMTMEAAADYFSMNNYMLQSVIFAPIAGIITSALVGWWVSRRKGKAAV